MAANNCSSRPAFDVLKMLTRSMHSLEALIKDKERKLLIASNAVLEHWTECSSDL